MNVVDRILTCCVGASCGLCVALYSGTGFSVCSALDMCSSVKNKAIKGIVSCGEHRIS